MRTATIASLTQPGVKCSGKSWSSSTGAPGLAWRRALHRGLVFVSAKLQAPPCRLQGAISDQIGAQRANTTS
jgi:hypothetical protein